MDSQFSIIALLNLFSESLGAWNLEILVEDSCTGNPTLIIVQIECLIAFQFWYVHFVWKTEEGEAESFMLIFVFWGVLIVCGLGVVRGRKSSAKPAEIASYSAKIPQRKKNISTSSLCGSGVNQMREEGRRVQHFLLLPQVFECFNQLGGMI